MRSYRHLRRGTKYVSLGLGKLQTAEPLSDEALLVFYRDLETGYLYARPPAEFHDGRFEPQSSEEHDCVGERRMFSSQPATCVGQIPGWVFVASYDAPRPFAVNYANWCSMEPAPAEAG